MEAMMQQMGKCFAYPKAFSLCRARMLTMKQEACSVVVEGVVVAEEDELFRDTIFFSTSSRINDTRTQKCHKRRP